MVRGEPPLGSERQDPKLQALRIEVERVATARSAPERAAQLARVLDAVSALAQAHGVSELELNALRAQPRSVARIKRQLKLRAGVVAARVWAGSGAAAAVRKQTARISPRSIATTLVKRQLTQSFGSARGPVNPVTKSGRSAFVLRGGRAREPQLIAASLLHLPRLRRQVMALRRSADVALSSATRGLASLPASRSGGEHAAAAGVLLRSGRSGLQLTYEVASASAQLLLGSYLLPRMLRYLSAGLHTGVALREVATARVLPPRTLGESR